MFFVLMWKLQSQTKFCSEMDVWCDNKISLLLTSLNGYSSTQNYYNSIEGFFNHFPFHVWVHGSLPGIQGRKSPYAAMEKLSCLLAATLRIALPSAALLEIICIHDFLLFQFFYRQNFHRTDKLEIRPFGYPSVPCHWCISSTWWSISLKFVIKTSF